MHIDFFIIRLVFSLMLVGAGYLLAPIEGNRLGSAALGGAIAAAIIYFETRVRRASLKTLIGAAVGSILGIVGAALIGFLISAQNAIPPHIAAFLTLAMMLFMAYVGLVVGAVARLIKPGKQNLSILMTLLLGVVGSIIGGVVASALGTGDIFELNILGAIVAIVAAVLLIGVAEGMSGRNRTHA